MIKMTRMQPREPWEIHPGLTSERLRLVGNLIVQARLEASSLHESSRGDNSWSLGCRAYSRVCFAIATAVAEEPYEGWLSIIEDAGLKFVFSVAGVPFRFYKGGPADSTNRTLNRRFPELRAQQLCLDLAQDPDLEMSFRLAVETDALGRAESVTVVQFDEEGRPHNAWPIPLDEVEAVAPIRPRREAVELPHPLQFPVQGTRNNQGDHGDGS